MLFSYVCLCFSCVFLVRFPIFLLSCSLCVFLCVSQAFSYVMFPLSWFLLFCIMCLRVLFLICFWCLFVCMFSYVSYVSLMVLLWFLVCLFMCFLRCSLCFSYNVSYVSLCVYQCAYVSLSFLVSFLCVRLSFCFNGKSNQHFNQFMLDQSQTN